MKLLTKKILKAFESQGDTSEMEDEDIKVIVKFFNPMGRGTWYAVEYDPKYKIFYGFVSLFGDHNDEPGDFALEDLESLKLPMGMGIERDMHLDPGEYTLSQIIAGERP